MAELRQLRSSASTLNLPSVRRSDTKERPQSDLKGYHAFIRITVERAA